MSTVKRNIDFVDVTQRDGEQQHIRDISVEERVEAFNVLASTGIKIFEVGHLGNQTDQQYVSRLIEHINNTPEYSDISLQVLFSTQDGLVEQGVEFLDGFDKQKVIIHVYDRLDENMRELATKPYDRNEAAKNVTSSIDKAYKAGFRRFSVSGEGASNSKVGDAMKYYGQILEHCEKYEEEVSVNINLPSTNGTSPVGMWREDELESFNYTIKREFPNTTTSVHAHNDFGSAVEFSLTAVRAGFDKVEGTLIGMGERTGNASLGDVAMRLLEIAKAESSEEVRRGLGRKALFNCRVLPVEFTKNMHNVYFASEQLAKIYGVENRFERTALGDPDAYNAGCGPHDQASARALEDPVKWPLYSTYIPRILTDAMLGRPEATDLIQANPDAIRAITVNGHASGGSTQKIEQEAISYASSKRRTEAEKNARQEIEKILATCTEASYAKKPKAQFELV